ncbi:MAG: hypothetical protein ACRD24_06615, partial [Terriglobales bacterium]
MKHIVAAFFVLFSLPVFMFGAPFLWSALKLRLGQPFYAGAADDYVLNGAVWVGLSFFILAPSALVLLKKGTSAGWLLISLPVLLLAMVALPSNQPPGGRGGSAKQAVEQRMETAAESLQSWASDHGQLPTEQG